MCIYKKNLCWGAPVRPCWYPVPEVCVAVLPWPSLGCSAASALPLVQDYLAKRLVQSYTYIYIHPCGCVGMWICINVGVYVYRFFNI